MTLTYDHEGSVYDSPHFTYEGLLLGITKERDASGDGGALSASGDIGSEAREGSIDAD